MLGERGQPGKLAFDCAEPGVSVFDWILVFSVGFVLGPWLGGCILFD
jgi:hypothetical protein